MATKKSAIKKISDKLIKVNESFSVNMYDNSYMIEISGRKSDDDWGTAKIMVSTIQITRDDLYMHFINYPEDGRSF